MMENLRYPIGTQSFEVLRNRESLYVDKTRFVYELANSSSTTFFLSRPRRFGKSLLLSTFEAYFRGKKDLFEGLAIYDLEKDWKEYPVLHFDLSTAEAKITDGLKNNINLALLSYAEEYGIKLYDGVGISDNFGVLIQKIVKTTGKQVVILIDEYDKGIVEALEDAERLNSNQELLQPFFSQIKAQNAYIRFCLITGVARFRHFTLFSGFNSPYDISMVPEYADICGITMNELLHTFGEGIHALADDLGLPDDDATEMLKQKYDGYRFTRGSTMVFNPFSILNALKNRTLENYWLQSGTSHVFVKYLTKSDFSLTDLTDMWVTKEEMEGTFDTETPIPLLFQSGYLTIKDYKRGLYRLDIPNGEVKSALVADLIPKYMGIANRTMHMKLNDLVDLLENGKVNGLMRELTSIIAKVPYHEFDYDDVEKTYHLVIYSIFLMMGVDAHSEIAMSGGRIDMVAITTRYVYVMEFKLDGTPQQAIDQIDERGYALPWQSDGRKVFKIGIVFSSKTRTISEWSVVTLPMCGLSGGDL